MVSKICSRAAKSKPFTIHTPRTMFLFLHKEIITFKREEYWREKYSELGRTHHLHREAIISLSLTFIFIFDHTTCNRSNSPESSQSNIYKIWNHQWYGQRKPVVGTVKLRNKLTKSQFSFRFRCYKAVSGQTKWSSKTKQMINTIF